MDIKQTETIEAYNNSAKDFMKKMGAIKNYKEVTVEVLKNYLVDAAGLPENHVKTATGDQKELDGGENGEEFQCAKALDTEP
ncbi:MAG: hypothetical protein LBK66_10560 [Spirochaetaceae bacterium]|jgi:hypothetical protein|nr:hypothetical protein [Spirochaetaceae bacterium]